MQPGQTVTPGTSQPPQEPSAPNDVSKQPEPVQEPALQAEAVSNWQYTADSEQPDQYAAPEPSVIPVTWTASEYISHNKGFSWFVLLGLGLFVLVAVVYLLTKDIFASIGVTVAGIAFAAFSVRPPRVLNYTIDSKGVQIGQRFYAYHDFKSFSVIEDGPLPSVLLMPLKRFLPPITIFCEPQAANDIIEALAAYLPHENRTPDAVDKLMAHLRF